MGKTRIKTKAVIAGGKRKRDIKRDVAELNDMFTTLFEDKDSEREIILPKILDLHEHLDKFCKIFDCFTESNTFFESFPEYEEERQNIIDFIQHTRENANISDEKTIDTYNDMNTQDLNEEYRRIKECSEVKEIMVTCSNLSVVKKAENEKGEIPNNFIRQEPGVEFCPFSFAPINFKVVWDSGKTDELPVINIFLISLFKNVYEVSHKIYEIITSPSVDVKRMSVLLMTHISLLRHNIPGCDDAFNKIERNVSTLENNFAGYYKASLQTNNPSLMVENFIIDVANEGGERRNIRMSSQFRKIIGFLHNNVNNASLNQVKRDEKASSMLKVVSGYMTVKGKRNGRG
jgi:hypothetical protein